MLVDYAKQETITPLKTLGRYLAFGVAGSLALAMGFLFIGLGVLRYGQTLDSFDGKWSSSVPYVMSLGALLVSIAICLSLLSRAKRKVA